MVIPLTNMAMSSA